MYFHRWTGSMVSQEEHGCFIRFDRLQLLRMLVMENVNVLYVLTLVV